MPPVEDHGGSLPFELDQIQRVDCGTEHLEIRCTQDIIIYEISSERPFQNSGNAVDTEDHFEWTGKNRQSIKATTR